jgi:3-oxoadipate enol-lactonase
MPTAELNGATIHYEVTGAGRPTFLMFNGAGLRLAAWGELGDRLSTIGTVIRFDQRGVGETVSEGPFSLATVAADALGLLDALEIGKVIAIGHAWGGRVAQVFARDYPERLSALVLCGTGGVLHPTFDPVARERLRTSSASGDRPAFEQAVVDLYCAKNFATRDPGAAHAVFDQMWEWRFDGKGATEASAATPSSSYAGAATCPVLLVYGSDDKFGTPDNARDLNQRLRGSRLIFIEDAGHLVIREQSGRVFEEIAAFVAEVGETGAASAPAKGGSNGV